MNDDNKAKPRVFFARVDQDGKRYASGIWDDGRKVYIKNFRETADGLIADVDYQTNEQYENKLGKMVFRHKVCGALKLSSTKGVLVIDIDGKKERLTCEPRNVNAKVTGEPMVVLDFGNGSSLNPYVDELMDDQPEQVEQTVEVNDIDKLVDDSVPF